MVAAWMSGGTLHVWEYPPKEPGETDEHYARRASAALAEELLAHPMDPPAGP